MAGGEDEGGKRKGGSGTVSAGSMSRVVPSAAVYD